LRHGAPEDNIRHVGDLGNIESNENGVAYINELRDHQVNIYNHQSVIGRAAVVHLTVDDLGTGDNEETFITGNAGARIACGLIQSLGDYQSSLEDPTFVSTNIVRPADYSSKIDVSTKDVPTKDVPSSQIEQYFNI
jgi:hypothetical protein